MSGPEPSPTLAEDQLLAGLDRARGADHMEEAFRAGHDIEVDGRHLRGDAGLVEVARQRNIATLELLSSIGLNMARFVELVGHPRRWLDLTGTQFEDVGEAFGGGTIVTSSEARHGCCGVPLGQSHDVTCTLAAITSGSRPWRNQRWRAGRRRGRNIYLQTSNVPTDSDVYLGTMETVELAELVIKTVNARLAARAEP